ncbi:MAG: outer membrane protein assembly factor BamA [Rhizobiaceae bacterium]|nr:outer membrane protein assembly factor BamA [Rhizobiaceae bacterium]
MQPLLRFFRILCVAFALVFAPLAVSFIVVVSSAAQVQAAVVQRIEVRGTTRMDSDTVISYLTISPGKNFSNSDIDSSVKLLFATGLFSDVSIYRSGRTLIVDVDENATINKIFFEGNKRLKDVALTGTVRSKARSIYNAQTVASDVERISQAYARVGRDDATVEYEIVPLENERVNVIYRINEGGKTKIGTINFVGNNSISDRRLKDVLRTKETNFLSFLGSSDIYDPNKLSADQELLRRYYFNKGFADFQVISASAELDGGVNEYIITITVDEGVRYEFGEIAIESTIPGVDAQSLYDLVDTVGGKYYSAKKVEDSIIALTQRIAANGYAFVEVVPRGNRNFETNTIDVTYLVDEGARVYIEDILIIGNDRTRDYVIRREFDVSEGDAFNQVLIQKTKRRLEALNYFEKVSINTRPGSSPDRVVVVVRLAEKSTGEFSIGGGYSSADGAIAEISFSEKNFLGRGQFIRLKFGAGADDQNYGFSFVEPFFLGYRMSAGINIDVSTSDRTDQREYSSTTTSGKFTLGVPLTDELNLQGFYTIRNSEINAADSTIDALGGGNTDGTQGNADAELSNALATYQGEWLASGFGYALIYNSFDDQKEPRNGLYASITQTIYGAGGDAEFVRSELTLAAYKELSDDLDVVAFGRVRAGNIADFGSVYRAQDNFYNNSKSIRGFKGAGLGPRDPVTGDALGGQNYYNATAELQFPIPFIPESAGFRGAFFADAGSVFGLDSTNRALVIASNPGLSALELQQLDDSSVRASVGASIIWSSPFGPLRFDYAFPVLKKDWDKTREFSFGISTKF